MFTVKIHDFAGREVTIEVSKEIFDLFEEERRELKRERDEYDRHGDDRHMEDYILARKMVTASEALEDLYFRRESLSAIRDLIRTCTPLQQERFTLYAEGYSLTEIARMQHCSKQSVQQSVGRVFKKIRRIL